MRGRRKETVSSRALAYMHRLLNHADRRVVGPLIGGTWPSAARQPSLLRVRVRAESLKPDQFPPHPFVSSLWAVDDRGDSDRAAHML